MARSYETALAELENARVELEALNMIGEEEACYIYNVDRVLEPLETIYDVLKKKSDYSDFLDFYSQYSTYAYDKDLSADYGKAVGVDSLFLHAHSPNGLPNIA